LIDDEDVENVAPEEEEGGGGGCEKKTARDGIWIIDGGQLK